ncbi:hypothetical protein PVM12_16705 [Enterobacter soli]|uniref:hypothetical protein n=1 Tax=Enterobacter soli TaxID=885040 RepID=UPI0023798A67|nr:hypothetical protein [Enterobacter soli]MDD9245670.1 hypothetical protein [Enterobacter soli]
MQKKEPGRTIEVRVNGALLAVLKTDTSVAADYISFMGFVANALMDKEALEVEANASGKTIMHSGFATFGSLPISDSTDP